ncbi:hypothetical protein B5807_03720 [Epicoccum nigrum]|uniref:Uncharacterized protein n=1 Tax=Epicoccum nigrum TaxID=105696 RepID=A0A1Y2M8N2_EPING|nr:hypothetical protein B5807_03720 [Epicoccum nigrum]
MGQSRFHFDVQAQVLHCRIHYVRLLILRPWLLENMDFASPTSLGGSTLQEIRSLCTLTARHTIDTVYEAEVCRPRSSTWHAVYFLHAAASALLAAALLPKASGGIDLNCEPYQMSWQKAIQTLKNNKVQLQASRQAVSLLESCREKLRSVVINKVPEDFNLSVLDTGVESLRDAGIDVNWAIDYNSLDFLQPDFFLNI